MSKIEIYYKLKKNKDNMIYNLSNYTFKII